MMNSQKKIALLHYSAPPIVGGVESVLGNHARLMADAGHKVSIVAGRGSTMDARVMFHHLPLADSLHPMVQTTKKQLDVGRVPSNLNELIDLTLDSLKQTLIGVDVIIAHNVCSLHLNLVLTAALRLFCAQPDAPDLIIWHHDLAWTVRRYQHQVYDGWPWQLIREDWPEVQPKHVVVSEWRRRELAQLFGLQPDLITVVPSGLDLQKFLKLDPQTTDLIHQLKLLEATPLFLLPVRIIGRKNIELAIQTIAAMRASLPQATLIVTGPPDPHNAASQSYFDELKRLRDQLHLNQDGPKVHFLAEVVSEHIPDAVIADFYRLADAMFLPSREEGFGIPILEAYLAGLPIFCADIPSLREIAGENATYFSPDDDPAILAKCMVTQLRRDPAYRASRHVREYFTWEAIYANQIEPLL